MAWLSSPKLTDVACSTSSICPGWAAIPAAVLLLDLIIYGQHVAFHAVPALWRLHRMHHADLEFDVTTGLRFHPGEILLSTVIKSAPSLRSVRPRWRCWCSRCC